LAILGATDLRLSLKVVLEEARARLQSDGGCIYVFHADSLVLDVAADVGDPTHDRERTVRLGDGVAGKAALERRTVWERDTDRTCYATPLVAKGSLSGALTVWFRSSFTPDHEWIDFFETVAGQAAMAVDNGRMFEDLQRSMLDLHLAYDTTIEGWSRALDLRDKETEGHTRRVTEMTVQIARMAGMSEAQLVQVKRGALLHDIGKMGVPDHILLKPGQLTEDEWIVMRKHPTYAYELLRPIEYLRDALDIPYCHHEKWDGSGYPRGLKGTEIPLAARLFAVVDIWDAIRSDRPYRKGWDEARSLEFIRSASGTHLDPRAVELFMRVVGEVKAPDRQAVAVER
jgi:HD-GYP domain-containing protein (c-di-GMP phosphodiesterase class II)